MLGGMKRAVVVAGCFAEEQKTIAPPCVGPRISQARCPMFKILGLTFAAAYSCPVDRDFARALLASNCE
jgi:hypothetical protein